MNKCVSISNTNKFGVNTLNRLGEDTCYLSTRENQSIAPGMYSLSNYKDCECGAKNTQCVSLQQPAVTYRDGYGWTSINGCNIDDDSKMRVARNLTNPRLVQQLHTRPYLTVPYMGRGPGNVGVESVLRPGITDNDRRPCNVLSGIYIDRFVPQIPIIKENVQNPVHLITEDNDRKWIWGGQPSRQFIRNTDYLNKCGFKYNGKLWARP